MQNKNSSPKTQIKSGNKIDPKTGREIDPVCGMGVLKHAFYRYTYEGKLYKFCNEDCLNDFKAEPLKYITSISEPGEHANSDTNTFEDTNNKQPMHANLEKDNQCCCNKKKELKQCCSRKSAKDNSFDSQKKA